MAFPNLDHSLHRDIFRVTDRMRHLKTSPGEITLHEYKNILTDVCGSVSASLDNGLRDAVRYAGSYKNDPKVLEEAQEIVRHFGNFVEFTNFEAEVLSEIGVQREVRDDLISILSEIRPMIDLERYDADEIIYEIETFRDSICKAADQAERFVSSEQQITEDTKRTLLTYGIALTIANATAVAITLGKLGPLLFVSSAGGGVLITKRSAIEDRFKKSRR